MRIREAGVPAPAIRVPHLTSFPGAARKHHSTCGNSAYLRDPRSPLSVHLLHLATNREQRDKRPHEHEPTGQQEQHTLTDLADVEILQPGNQNEPNQGQHQSNPRILRRKSRTITVRHDAPFNDEQDAHSLKNTHIGDTTHQRIGTEPLPEVNVATMRNDHTYVKHRDALRRIAQRKNLPCHLCGQPIDWDAHWASGKAFTADHIDAVATGGHMHGKLKPAHRSCNSQRGAKSLTEYADYKIARGITRPIVSSEW